MPNSFAVQFQRNIVDEPLPLNKSQALPAHTPIGRRLYAWRKAAEASKRSDKEFALALMAWTEEIQQASKAQIITRNPDGSVVQNSRGSQGANVQLL
jgi:hypothetical protein